MKEQQLQDSVLQNMTITSDYRYGHYQLGQVTGYSSLKLHTIHHNLSNMKKQQITTKKEKYYRKVPKLVWKPV